MASSRRHPVVTHLVPALFGPGGVVGGAERYAYELARHMADRAPTRLVTFGQAPASSRAGALDIEVVGPPRFVRGQASNPFAWRAIALALRGDVVHCHQQHILVTTIAAAAARAPRTPRRLHRPRRRRLGPLGVHLDRPSVPRAPAHQRVQPRGVRPAASRACVGHLRRGRLDQVLAAAARIDSRHRLPVRRPAAAAQRRRPAHRGRSSRPEAGHRRAEGRRTLPP